MLTIPLPLKVIMYTQVNSAPGPPLTSTFCLQFFQDELAREKRHIQQEMQVRGTGFFFFLFALTLASLMVRARPLLELLNQHTREEELHSALHSITIHCSSPRFPFCSLFYNSDELDVDDSQQIHCELFLTSLSALLSVCTLISNPNKLPVTLCPSSLTSCFFFLQMYVQVNLFDRLFWSGDVDFCAKPYYSYFL